ncbi:hypothetical protein C2845_PM01G19830 [Panicum miliaceum]|uniref:Uncharacterized protein n=1 Tax=Panicum miliaceum TaxID=4540 RepID=A0A3L6TFM6_PANMI|nr:hypothetical protein C2845_PM01G19830 [Panicum miliaceum]
MAAAPRGGARSRPAAATPARDGASRRGSCLSARPAPTRLGGSPTRAWWSSPVAAEKNTEGKTPTFNRDISCRFALLDVNSVAHASPSMDAPPHGTTSQDGRESVAKHCAAEKAGMRSIVKMLPEHRAKEVRTTYSSQCLNDKAGHSLIGERLDDCKESATDKNTIVYVMEGQDLQEADDEIQMLNDLGLGEDISSDEFYRYFKQLPAKPAVDIYAKLDNEQLTALYERHARYRIRYLKLSQTDSMDKLNAELKQHNAMDLLEEDLSRELLAKMRYFKHFEEDGTLDWFFHPDLCRLEALDDYQRLVLRNHDGSEYIDWDKYRRTVHSSYIRNNAQKSFRDALEEIYRLEMFPSRQERMKYALDYDCSDMEMEFLTCTASVTSEIGRPKLYEHYIRKKIAIAQAIGLIPTAWPHCSAEAAKALSFGGHNRQRRFLYLLKVAASVDHVIHRHSTDQFIHSFVLIGEGTRSICKLLELKLPAAQSRWPPRPPSSTAQQKWSGEPHDHIFLFQKDLRFCHL